MTSLGFCRNRPESSADKMYRACKSKDQTFKKIRTLHFPEELQECCMQLKQCTSFLFVRPSFFLFPSPPQPSPGTSLPWDLRTTLFVEERQPARAGFLGRVLGRSFPTGKKGTSFKNGAREKMGTVYNHVLPFLDFLFCQGKPLKLTKDFCPLPNPLKSEKA